VTARGDVLKSIPLFGGLSGRDREFLARNMDEVNFAAGEVLIREGESNHTLFVLMDGEVEISVSGQPRRTMRPGDFFGEISMDKLILATASVVAKTPVHALVMSREQYRALSGSAPTLARLQAAIGDRLAHDRMLSDEAGRPRT
jgi:CRP-like cAMP-binding protein